MELLECVDLYFQRITEFNQKKKQSKKIGIWAKNFFMSTINGIRFYSSVFKYFFLENSIL